MLKKPAVQIVGVCGSPRRGNTEWMLSTLCRAFEQVGAKVDVLLLRKMDVRMCRGCLACEKGGKERKGECVIKDDMAAVYPKLLAADVIVLATPGYMGLLSGLMKNFLDRHLRRLAAFGGQAPGRAGGGGRDDRAGYPELEILRQIAENALGGQRLRLCQKPRRCR